MIAIVILLRVFARMSCFCANVVVAKTSYQILRILSFSDRERALPPSTEISELTSGVKKVQ